MKQVNYASGLLIVVMLLGLSACTSTTPTAETKVPVVTTNDTTIDITRTEDAIVEETAAAESTVPDPAVDENRNSELALTGNCANTFYPVVAGATWNYTSTNASIGTSTFVRSINAVSENGFADQDVLDTGTTRTGNWSCANGTLTALDQGALATVNVATDTSSTTFIAESTESSGITMPAELTVGDSWDQTVLIVGTVNVSESLNAKASAEVNTTCTPIGMETISVAAGTFEAMKINCTNQLTMIIEMESTGPMTMPFQSTSDAWYARNVGLVKIVDTSDLGISTIELSSYSIPEL